MLAARFQATVGATPFSIGIGFLGVAIVAGGWALGQLWLFWVAPVVGALLGAAIYRFIGSSED